MFLLEKIKKTPRLFVTIATLLAAAGINYQIIHSPIVLVATAVLFVHEFGHYIMAKYKKAKVKLPIFIPLPFFIIGITQVSDLLEKDIPSVAIAGPIFGVIAALLFTLLNTVFRFTSFFSLAIIAATEVIFNYFGSDGIKYRKYSRRKQQCIL